MSTAKNQSTIVIPERHRMAFLICFLALFKFILPYFLQSSQYELHRDEYLYLADGAHLSWGYMEMPPLLAVLGRISLSLGGHILWVKFFPAAVGALTFIITSKIITGLKGGYFAVLLNFLAMTFGAYLSVHFLFQPNFLEILFASLMSFAIFKFIQTQKVIWLYGFGIAFGLGMLSKSSTVLMIISLAIGLLLSPQRTLFKSIHLYAAVLLGVTIFLPNALWEYYHNFPLLAHVKELQEKQLSHIEPIDIIKGQLILNLPTLFIWIAGLFFILFSKYGRPYILFLWTYCILMLMLILLNGKDYYGLPIYPILFCFGCVYLERLTIKKTILRVLMLAVSISLSIVDLPMELPITNPGRLAMIYKKYHYERFGILKWEDGRNHLIKQDFADMLGWKEIAGKTMAAFNGLTLQDQKKTIIYRSNYGICGAINFYTKDSSFPGSYTDNASFVMWMPRQFEFEHVLFVGHAIPDRWLPRFKAVQVLGELNSVYARESGLKIFLFEQADSSFHSLLHQMIFNKKNEFLF